MAVSTYDTDASAALPAAVAAPPIQTAHLTESHGEIAAVRDVDVRVERGEVFAFLGPDAAGITITILCNLEHPTPGRAWVEGFDVVEQPRSVRRRIGLVVQEQTPDDQVTAGEDLPSHGVLHGLPGSRIPARVDELLALVGRGDTLVQTFPGGTARRPETARALMRTPDVLLLDEPTLGLGPQTRALLWRDVLRLREEHEITVSLTTHYRDEAAVVFLVLAVRTCGRAG